MWRYLSSYESTDDAQVDVHLYPVSARVSGYVVKVNVDDNQWVEKGTVLVEIDPKDYEVAVEQAQANLASAEATAQSLNITVPITSVNTSSQLRFTASGIEDANAGVTAAEKQLAAAHAQVESAEANDVKAQDDLHRYKLLVDKQEVSQQIYDQALAAAKSSTATVSAARASESAAEQFVKQARSRLAQADANYKSAETGPQQVSSTQARVRAAIADVEQKRAAARAGSAESRIHEDRRAGHRRSEQDGGRRHERPRRPATAHRRAARRSLGHRQFQGNAAEAHASRAKSGNSRGFERPDFQGPCGQHRRSDRPAVQPASAGKCHRQLRENRAAHSGKDRSRTGREPGSPASAGHECRARRVLQ